MSYLFSTESDVQTCVDQLVAFANQSDKFDVAFGRWRDPDDSLDFAIKRKTPSLTSAHPSFRGRLTPSDSKTQVFGQMRKQGSRVFFLLWCSFIALFGSLLTAMMVVLALRTRLAGFTVEPSFEILLPLSFIFFGLFLASYLEKMQLMDPRDFLEWIYNCFDEKPNEELIEIASEIKKQPNFTGLTRRTLLFTAAGLVVGTLLGLAGDVEDNLDPLRITVTDLHTCAPSDDGNSFVRQDIFNPTDVIYGCGNLDIEIIDHRQIKIDIWLRRDYQNSNEGPAGHIAHAVNAAGEFALALRAPQGGRYQIGEYKMQIGRSKNRYGEITFDIVDR